MSRQLDWGKMIGGVIAAALIALQVGMDSKLETHEEITQRDVKRLEDNTMHTDSIDAQFELLQSRILVLERQMNSMYVDMNDGTE